MRTRTSTGLLLLAVALAGCGKGGGLTALGGAKEYQLAVDVKQGEKYPYSISMKGDAAGQSLEGTLSMTVLKVEGANTTLEVKFDSIKFPEGTDPAIVAAAEQVLKQQVSKTTVDRHWNTVAKSGDAAGNAAVSPASLPTKKVKVGDSWEAKTDTAGKQGSGTGKFVSVENVGGKEIAVLEVTTAKEEGVEFAGPILYKVEIATGMPWELSFSTMDANKAKATFELKRIVGSAPKPVVPAKA